VSKLAAMSLGVEIPPLAGYPSKAAGYIASLTWLVVSLPFMYLAYEYWNSPQSIFVQWRGWVFALVAAACIAMAALAPPRYRVAIVGTRVRAWARIG
jgi:hypothetical protein